VLISHSLARRLAHLLMPFVGIATLLGGSVFWLRRVGWLQADTYYFTNSQLIIRSGESEPQKVFEYVLQHHGSLHQLDGWLQASKYGKELVLVAFVLLGLSQLTKLRLPPRPALANAGLFGLAGVSALLALLAGQWFAFLAGARSFAAWCIGALATPLVDAHFRRRFARVCAWTLVAESVLVAIESWRGMLIYAFYMFGRDNVRVVGTFNLPASLGAFVVVSWAVAWCWGGFSRRGRALLTALALLVMLVNASATAWVAFAAVSFIAAYRCLPRAWRLGLLAAALPLALTGWLALPTLTGRLDVHDSLWGRIAPIQNYAAQHSSARQLLFGTGFGVGTNALAAREPPRKSIGTGYMLPNQPVGDSTPAVLFWQTGLLGLACAYALMLLAIRARPESWQIGVALAVSSLAINIAELFPVNLALGFWLAHALSPKATDAPA
jgi:hypothetical protein